MIVYDFNGYKVPVQPGKVVLVITAPEGDCVSSLPYDKKIEGQLERGIWDDSFVYKADESGVKCLGKPKGWTA
jgi:hypothetical protein